MTAWVRAGMTSASAGRGEARAPHAMDRRLRERREIGPIKSWGHWVVGPFSH